MRERGKGELSPFDKLIGVKIEIVPTRPDGDRKDDDYFQNG
jgi:hypothetical protein